MLERQQETAVVCAVEAGKEFRIGLASGGGRGPLTPVFVIYRTEGLAQVVLVEMSADRGVLLVRRRDVLILRQRIQPAVPGRRDCVFEESRPFVHEKTMIGSETGVALAAHFGRSEQIVEVGGVVLELRLPRRSFVVDLEVQLLLRRRRNRRRDIERIETERIGDV